MPPCTPSGYATENNTKMKEEIEKQFKIIVCVFLKSYNSCTPIKTNKILNGLAKIYMLDQVLFSLLIHSQHHMLSFLFTPILARFTSNC